MSQNNRTHLDAYMVPDAFGRQQQVLPRASPPKVLMKRVTQACFPPGKMNEAWEVGSKQLPLLAKETAT